MKNILMLFMSLAFAAACSSGGGDDGGNNGFGGGDKGGNNGGTTTNGVVNLKGTWKGTGSIQANGQTINCSDVTFQFEQSASSLKVVKGDYACDQGASVNWAQEEVQINGNTLSANNQNIGTVNGDTVTVNNAAENSKITMKRNGNKLNVTEIYQNDGVTLNASLTLQ